MAVMIQVRDLSKRFGAVTAVDKLSFEVREGEIFGFLGPNGAGKTTTISILTTLLRPTGGQITLNGYDVVRQPNDVRKSIGIVFQEPSLDNRLNAEQNLRFHAMLYGVPRAEMERRIDEALDLVELSDRRKVVKAFSGGMRRRLELARGLLHAPRVLFLDEPTIGLDPRTRLRIWDYVLELRRRTAMTVFMTTHYMEEAAHCDRIAIIDRGRLVALDAPDVLRQTVGGDVIMIRSADPAGLAEAVQQRFGIPARVAGAQVILEREGGAMLVSQIVEAFPGLVQTVSVQPPTLDDVFVKITGGGIRPDDQRRTGKP